MAIDRNFTRTTNANLEVIKDLRGNPVGFVGDLDDEQLFVTAKENVLTGGLEFTAGGVLAPIATKRIGIVSSGLRLNGSGVVASTNKSSKGRGFVTITEDFAAGDTLIALFPLFYIPTLTTPTRLADTDLPDALFGQFAIDSTWQAANTGLTTTTRIPCTDVNGNTSFSYDPATPDTLGAWKVYWTTPTALKRGQRVDFWYYIESLAAGPNYNLPKSIKQTSNTAQSYEFCKMQTVTDRDSIYSDTTFTVQTGVNDTPRPVVMLGLVPSDQVNQVAIGDSIFEGVYDQFAVGSTGGGGNPRGDKLGNTGVYDKYISTRMGKGSMNLSKGSDMWLRQNPATAIAAGFPSYTKYRDAILKFVADFGCPVEIHTNFGTNDIDNTAAATLLATVKANAIGTVANWKAQAPGAKIIAWTLLPNANGTALGSGLQGVRLFFA